MPIPDTDTVEDELVSCKSGLTHHAKQVWDLMCSVLADLNQYHTATAARKPDFAKTIMISISKIRDFGYGVPILDRLYDELLQTLPRPRY